MISASLVKELREKTGAGMMDCKKALTECNGDINAAVDWLREKGIAKAAKKATRIAAEGLCDVAINGNKAYLYELNSETDFVSNNEDFKQFVKDIAMHIAATGPKYVRREEVPAEVVEKEKETLKAQALNEGKPEAVVERMVEGRLNKFYSEICLLDQPFVKDPDKTVQELLTELIAKIGENIVIRRFARFERGEGIEKEEVDFAEEVMKQVKGN